MDDRKEGRMTLMNGFANSVLKKMWVKFRNGNHQNRNLSPEMPRRCLSESGVIICADVAMSSSKSLDIGRRKISIDLGVQRPIDCQRRMASRSLEIPRGGRVSPITCQMELLGGVDLDHSFASAESLKNLSELMEAELSHLEMGPMDSMEDCDVSPDISMVHPVTIPDLITTNAYIIENEAVLLASKCRLRIRNDLDTSETVELEAPIILPLRLFLEFQQDSKLTICGDELIVYDPNWRKDSEQTGHNWINQFFNGSGSSS